MASANIGDFEAGRAYPLTITAAATEVPGYEGCSTALQTAFDALPLGASFLVVSSAIPTVIPVGAVFAKRTTGTYGSGNRINRIVNPSVDTLNLGVATHPFIGTLAAVDPGGGTTLRVSGTLRLGNGLATTSGLVRVSVGTAGGGLTITAAAGTGTLQSGTGGAANTGMVATVLAGAAGAFAVTFTYSGASAATPVVIEYMGLSISTTVDVA